jgi:signal peptidase I
MWWKKTKVFLDSFYTLAALILIRFMVINWYVIPTGSMMPTIKKGDHIFCNKLAYGLMFPFMENQTFTWDTPKRGDIVIFQYPKGSEVYVKRVVGIEGDKVSFREGVLHINNKPIEEVEILDRKILEDMGESADDKTLYEEKGLGPDHYIMRLKHDSAIRRITLQLADRMRGLPSNPSVYSTEGDVEERIVPPGKIFVMGDNRDGSNDSRFWGYVESKKVYGRALSIFFSTIPQPGLSLPQFRWDRWFKALQ